MAQSDSSLKPDAMPQTADMVGNKLGEPIAKRSTSVMDFLISILGWLLLVGGLVRMSQLRKPYGGVAIRWSTNLSGQLRPINATIH